MVQRQYSSEVQRQPTTGVGAHAIAVDLRLSVLKTKHADWVVEIYSKFESDKGVTISKKGFTKAGITEAIEMIEVLEQDPFSHLIKTRQK